MQKKQIIIFTILSLSLVSTFQKTNVSSGINLTQSQEDNFKIGITYAGYSDFNFDYEYLPRLLQQWGYEVEELSSFQSLITNDIDIIVIPKLRTDLSPLSISQIKNWWDSGNKSIWITGDAIQDVYDVIAITNANTLLHNINSSIFLEHSSVHSYYEDYNNTTAVYNSGVYYYDSSYIIADQYSEHEILQDCVYDTAYFASPAIVVGYNGTEYVAIEEYQPQNVKWLIKTSSAENVYSNYLEPTCVVHEKDNISSFVLMASQTWDNGNKLIVSGESIFTCDNGYGMFPNYEYYINDHYYFYSNIENYDFEGGFIRSDNPFIVYNTFCWFTGQEKNDECFIELSTEVTYLTFESVSVSLKISDYSNIGSGIAFFSFSLNDRLIFSIGYNQEITEIDFIVDYDDLISYTKIEAFDFSGNKIIDETTEIFQFSLKNTHIYYLNILYLILILGFIGLTSIVLVKKV